MAEGNTLAGKRTYRDHTSLLVQFGLEGLLVAGVVSAYTVLDAILPSNILIARSHADERAGSSFNVCSLHSSLAPFPGSCRRVWLGFEL